MHLLRQRMITKLDWYILKKFFTLFIFCMLMFTVIAIAVDSSEHTDDFVKSGLSTKEIIRQYYFGFVPWIWGLLYPLFVFIAVIFFTSKMALRSEVVAIIASGTTYNRWLRPYLIGGLLLATGLWFANAYGIPKANELKSSFQAKYLDVSSINRDQTECMNCFYRRMDAETYIGIKNYDSTSKTAGLFFMEKVRNNKVYYNLRANRLEWDSARRNWKLQNAVERRVDSMGERLTALGNMNIDLKIQPRELRRDDYLKDQLSSPDLSRFIKAEQARGREGLNALKVELYRRSATPFTVLLLTLIGAVVAGRKTRGGSGLHLALGFVIAAAFILLDRFSTVFSVKGNMPPVLAAWIPNAIFTFIAIYLYRRAPK